MTACRILSSICRTVAALAIVGVALALTSCTTAEQAAVVARVNGETITASELLDELRKRRGAPTLVDLIDTALIEQGAEQAGITASDEEMQLRWQRAMAEAGSETDMRGILEQRGVTEDDYRERLRIDLLLDKLARETMNIPEQEIKDFYNEHREDYALGDRVKAKMILVASETDARHIRDALDDPDASFEGLARALSIDPATKDDGGDMGWFERDAYARAITDVAFEMQPGEISDPIEVPDGWVLLEVEGHQDAGYRPLEEVRDEVVARITRMKQSEARAAWIRQAREAAVVRVRDSQLREATMMLLENAPPPASPSLLPVPPPQ
ncbi:MAG: peptidyl-prolyl cis-trans isomerase [Armatimonadota bacterium]|jgi:foldase protein PrsA